MAGRIIPDQEVAQLRQKATLALKLGTARTFTEFIAGLYEEVERKNPREFGDEGTNQWFGEAFVLAVEWDAERGVSTPMTVLL